MPGQEGLVAFRLSKAVTGIVFHVKRASRARGRKSGVEITSGKGMKADKEALGSLAPLESLGH